MKRILLKDIYNFYQSMNWIDEGMFYTHKTDECIDILKDKFSEEPYNMSFEEGISDGGLSKIKVYFNGKTLKESNFKELIDYLYKCGYYPSYYLSFPGKTKKYDESEILKNFNNGLIGITFDIIKDFKMDMSMLPDFVFHVTLLENKDKILKIGLQPKSENKFEKHSDRIYFVLTPSDVDKLLHHKEFVRDNSKFIIFKLDLKSLINDQPQIEFFKDRSFKDRAIYTKSNINPKYLKVEDEIDITSSKEKIKESIHSMRKRNYEN